MPIFEDLASAALADAVSRLRPVELAVGDAIEEQPGRLLLVRSGRAEVRVPGIGGGWDSTAELGPGDSFGLAALLGAARGAQLVALEPTRLLVLDDAALGALAASYPSVAAALEGQAPAVAPPEGARRLSRMVMRSRVEHSSALAPQPRPPAPDADAVVRASGAFPRVS